MERSRTESPVWRQKPAIGGRRALRHGTSSEQRGGPCHAPRPSPATPLVAMTGATWRRQQAVETLRTGTKGAGVMFRADGRWKVTTSSREPGYWLLGLPSLPSVGSGEA